MSKKLLLNNVRKNDINFDDVVIDPTYNYFVFDTSLVESNEVTLSDLSEYGYENPTYDYGLTDWGDGTVDSRYYHTYDTNGIYLVKTRYVLNGDYVLASNTVKMLIDCLNISNIKTSLEFKRRYFYNCINLKEIALTNCDMSETKTLYSMFGWCSSLTSVDLSGWNIDKLGYASLYSDDYWFESGQKGTNSMFYNCPSLVYVNLSGWNIKVDFDATNMFLNCTSLMCLNLSNCSDATINKFVPQLPVRSDDKGVIYVSEIKSTYPSVSGWSYELA